MSYTKIIGIDQQMLADLVWNGRTGVFVCDGDGFILGANEYFCRLLRFGEVELTGRHFGELLLGRDLGVVVGEFERLIKNDKHCFDLDVAFVSKLGGPIGVHLFVKRGESSDVVFGVGQVVEALSPEQVEAMGVLSRGLMDDWLISKGLVVGKKITKWWESATFWAAIAALWPIVLGLVFGFNWVMKLFYGQP